MENQKPETVISEKDANKAREEFSDELAALGAHSIGVDQIDHDNGKTFAVIAFVEKKNKAIPELLTVKKGGRTLKVPVKVQVSKKFKPE